MAGPMHSILYIHNAILHEFKSLEETAKALNYDSKGDAGALLDRFQWFRNVLTIHEDSEESSMLPQMEQRFRYSSVTYEFDHGVHTGFYDLIEQLLGRIGNSGSATDRRSNVRELYRETVALHAVMDEHIDKENQILIAAFDEHFSVEEQAAMLAEIMGHLPPEMMQEALPWMFSSQPGTDDREGFVRELLEMAPPPMLPATVGLLASSADQKHWADMLARIPELGTIAAQPPPS